MRQLPHRALTMALAVALCGAASAWAAASSTLPPEQTHGQIKYLSGGMTKDQETAMQRAASEYPLELKFMHGKASEMSLTNVPVTIKDHTGKVILDTRSEGPVMLAKLPDGRYTVSAEEAGNTQTHKVKIEQNKHETLVFNWKR